MANNSQMFIWYIVFIIKLHLIFLKRFSRYSLQESFAHQIVEIITFFCTLCYSTQLYRHLKLNLFWFSQVTLDCNHKYRLTITDFQLFLDASDFSNDLYPRNLTHNFFWSKLLCVLTSKKTLVFGLILLL